MVISQQDEAGQPMIIGVLVVGDEGLGLGKGGGVGARHCWRQLDGQWGKLEPAMSGHRAGHGPTFPVRDRPHSQATVRPSTATTNSRPPPPPADAHLHYH